MSTFDRAFGLVLGSEGGYSNDPRDRGGETKFGIADAADGRVDGKVDLNRDGVPDVAVSALTVQQAKEVYKVQYWDRVQGDKLPPKLAVCMFDAAVNQGVSAAVKALQRAVGVQVDGVLGTGTLRAVQALPEALAVQYFMAERALLYAQNSQLSVYGRGWMRRLIRTVQEA